MPINRNACPSFVVSFDGTPVNMVPLQTYPSYTLYGGNISSWAGQSASIKRNRASSIESFIFANHALQLDDITFSPTAVSVPEPDTLVLMAVGGALFAAFRRFASERQ